MTSKAISPLRARMIDDMMLRRFGEKTQNDYIRHVKNFTIFLGRAPDTAEPEDLRRYQVHQSRSGVQPPTMLFTTTCNRPEMARHLTLVRQAQKLPVVLTQAEAALRMEAAPGAKYKAALGVAYGAGLRVSEVANLKISDIDRDRMVLRVEQGKAGKIATPCRRRACLACWKIGGRSAGRPRGCSPVAIRFCRSQRANCTGWCATRRQPSASTSVCRRTRSGTRSRHTCWSKASTSA